MTSYLWSRACAWGLTISVVVLGVAGVAAIFEPSDTEFLGLSRLQWCVGAFACMAALSIASANNAAAAAMHAISRPSWHWATLWPALICAVGFAIASNLAVHLGWTVLAAQAAGRHDLPDAWMVDTAALFLCFAKPAMTWIVEGRHAMDMADAAAKAAADAAELEAIRAASRPARQPFQPEVLGGGRVSAHAAQAGAVSAGLVGGAVALPPEAPSWPEQLTVPAHSQQTWAGPEEHAADLLMQGWSQQRIANVTGLSRWRVRQIQRGLANAA